MIKKILIANRGEIAVRIIRARIILTAISPRLAIKIFLIMSYFIFARIWSNSIASPSLTHTSFNSPSEVA